MSVDWHQEIAQAIMRYVLINMEDSTVDAVIGFEETLKQRNASVSFWTIPCLFQPFDITFEIMHAKKCLLKLER